jgi:hypothetical protein
MLPPTSDEPGAPLGINPDRAKVRLNAVLDALLARAERGDLEAARSVARFAAGHSTGRAARALDLTLQFDPRDDWARLALARLRASSGDLDAARREAETVFADAIDQAARAQAALALGDICRLEGAYAEARIQFAEALAIEAQILMAHPSDTTALRWHARALGRIAELDIVAEDLPRARTNAEGAHKLLAALADQLGEEPILAADIADSELRLAQLALADDKANAMKPHLEQALARYEALTLLEKTEPHWRDRLAETWALMAEADLALSDAKAARAAMDKAVSQRVWLANQEPAERWGLAAIWRLRAGLLAALGDRTAAAESLGQAVVLAEGLGSETLAAGAQPNPDQARFVLRTRLEQADLAFLMGDLKTARDAADAARAHGEHFARQDKAWAGDLAAAWDRLGDIAKAVSSAEKANDAFSRAVELRRMHQADSDSASLKRALAAALLKAGEIAMELKNAKAARSAFAESFALRLELAELGPGQLEPARDLAVALERLGLAALADDDEAGARSAWEQELALIEHIHAAADPAGIRFAAIAESLLANLGGKDGERHRQSARVRMAQLATLTALTEQDAALIQRLGSDL